MNFFNFLYSTFGQRVAKHIHVDSLIYNRNSCLETFYLDEAIEQTFEFFKNEHEIQQFQKFFHLYFFFLSQGLSLIVSIMVDTSCGFFQDRIPI